MPSPSWRKSVATSDWPSSSTVTARLSWSKRFSSCMLAGVSGLISMRAAEISMPGCEKPAPNG